MNEDSPSSKINWRPLLLTGIVSLFVGVASGVLINFLTEKRLRLTYDVTTQEVFPGEQHNVGIFALRVVNDGKREIEQIFCRLTFNDGQITERAVSGIPESARTLGGTGKAVEVNVPFLNPSEQFSVQVLMNDTSQSLPRPFIELRGKGIVGTEARVVNSTRDRRNELLAVIGSVIAALGTAVILTTQMTRRYRRDRTLSLMPILRRPQLNPPSTPDERDVIAYALEANGLAAEASVIRFWNRTMRYWAGSDYLTNKWLADNDREVILKGLNALEFLLKYTYMGKQARRIVSLNAARLALFVEDGESTIRYLKDALSVKDHTLSLRLHADRKLLTFAIKHDSEINGKGTTSENAS